MDDAVRTAMIKWPDVPACYGWLSLDRRGQWRLQGEPVRHGGLETFLQRNYSHDEMGNWFVQNGPQKVFVELDYAPWVLRLANESSLVTHTGLAVQTIERALLDEEGNLLLLCEHGPALLDDRDLPALLACMEDADGHPASDDDLLTQMATGFGSLFLRWQQQRIPLESLLRREAAEEFSFIALPSP